VTDTEVTEDVITQWPGDGSRKLIKVSLLVFYSCSFHVCDKRQLTV
jgi:hypothetical protein